MYCSPYPIPKKSTLVSPTLSRSYLFFFFCASKFYLKKKRWSKNREKNFTSPTPVMMEGGCRSFHRGFSTRGVLPGKEDGCVARCMF